MSRSPSMRRSHYTRRFAVVILSVGLLVFVAGMFALAWGNRQAQRHLHQTP